MSGGGFDAAWLALREPADAAARDAALARRLRAHGPADGPWRIVDLGAGTGANRRWLAPRLGGRQRWTLVDNDPLLLRYAAAPGVRQVRLDLAGDLGALAPRQADLVTASALLDLVSEAWLEQLVGQCRRRDAVLHFALSYDGRIDWTPGDRDDERVRQLVNRHQQGDKGFGPALGPAAGDFAARLLRRCGYRVRTAPSPWRLGPGQVQLQEALLAGWLSAAVEIAPQQATRLAKWAARRRRYIAAQESHLVVGHVDVLGVPRRFRIKS
ncbi:MAG: class I SAM-dependent methyltransferase [Proteobacteria bacterium]|nr:class I SAM-dependent methyltransferase [Pseudomonadota bacterium]